MRLEARQLGLLSARDFTRKARTLELPAHSFRTLISAATLVSFLVGTLAPAFAAGELSRADYEKCQGRSEADLKSTLESISLDALKTGIKGVDYRALVGEQWRKNGLDEIIDKRVDIAVEEVKSETSWTERLSTLTNSEASQKLATQVAERVYHSDAAKAAMESLASGVAREVGKSIELASTDASEPLLDCLKAFLGPRYGSAVADAVAGDTAREIDVDPAKGSSQISSGAVLKESGGGIAGVTLLVVRRQLSQLATRIGQRIAGSVLSRLVSVAAGGVGLVLIAKDIWDFRHGVLPIIATEMKSANTKSKVQDEVASEIDKQIAGHVQEIAAASAEHAIEIWQSFRRAHALVLKIAERDGGFRTFLDRVSPPRLPRLDEIVGMLVAEEGEEGVLKRLSDGSLNEAVHNMPDAGFEIARDTKSVARGLAWTALAGDKLGVVLSHEIYRRAEPDDFTRPALDRLLALDDRTAISRLAGAGREARAVLFSLDNSDLMSLARNLSDGELKTLASYMNGLQGAPRERVLRAVAANPAKMQALAPGPVRDAILASRDQAAAADMMLRASDGFSPRAFADDARLVWEERVSPWLLWHRHPLGVLASGLGVLIMLTWLRRLFRRRPPAAPSQGPA